MYICILKCIMECGVLGMVALGNVVSVQSIIISAGELRPHTPK